MRQFLGHFAACTKLEHCRKLNKVTFLLIMAFTLAFYVISNNYVEIRLHFAEDQIYPTKATKNFSDQDKVLLKIPECGCEKYVHRNPEIRNPKHTPQNGTCSVETFSRGPGQKIIGFTFYEPIKEEKEIGKENEEREDKSKRNYLDGIKDNLQLIKEKYGSDWIVRVYYHVKSYDKDSPVMKQLCDLACSEPNLDLCDAQKNPRLGNATLLYPLLWRFLPVIDVNVDFYLSRDLDSRISDREVAAVNEFLESDRDIHVMRDHPAHSTYILGGTWGAKVDKQRRSFMDAFKKLFHDGLAYIPREKGGGYDQIALMRYIWPWGKKVALSHDSYCCRKFSNTSPFPTKRLSGVGNFIGSVISLNQSVGFDSSNYCPEKCRPKNHKDWVYC